MLPEAEREFPQKDGMANDLKSWVMISLTFIFVILYIAALAGLFKPLDKDKWDIFARLEPIIFVIIGYYFGRLPAQQNEKSLKDEINRQTQKADAAQHIKEKAGQEREVLEEKIKNASLVLTKQVDDPPHGGAGGTQKTLNTTDTSGIVNNSLETALSILNS